VTAPGAARVEDPWLECAPELNARLLRPLLRFYELQFGRAALLRLVEELGTTLEVLEDPDRWFSAALVLRVNRAMIAATGDEDLIYRAGRALTWPGMLGAERLLMRGLLNPRGVYESFGHITARYSRITRWEMQSLGRGTLRATFVPAPGTVDDPLFCGNRRGVLEAVPEVFGFPAASLEHPLCLHRGDDRCVYIAHWKERMAWARPALLAAAGLGVAAGVAGVFDTWGAAAVLGAGATVCGGVGLWLARRHTPPELTGSPAEDLQDLLERNARRVQELQALQRVMEATRTILDEEELIDEVLSQLTSVLGYDRALLLRVDPARGVLARARARGFGAQSPLVESLEVSLDPVGADERLFGRIVRAGRPELVTDTAAYAERLLPANRALLEELRSTSFVAAPVEGGGTPLGLLVVDRQRGAALSLRDRDLLAAAAAAVGAALGNARLYRQVQEELLINRKFRQYLPASAADEVRRNPDAAARLGGREEDLAVMFCDVAGFTAMSARCEPGEVVRGLNAWFSVADPVLEAAGGIVDKRIGDGILAVFRHVDGAPHPAERAVDAALRMQQALGDARARLAREAPAFAGLQVRHAIHYGRVVLGNVGTETRMEYTVIGDAVNTCARVEERTPAGDVWLTEDAVAAIGVDRLPGATRVEEVVLRGRGAPTGLWRVGALGWTSAGLLEALGGGGVVGDRDRP
jgi:class 3 adenylate cyclase